MADIGIVGGTFDPIHNGHLLLGRQAFQEYHLQQVWFMPSGRPPHKKDHPVTDARVRGEMVQLALAGEPCFRLSDFEIKRPGNTYTAQTLELLKEQYPHHRFYFILGADSLYQIESWYQPEKVLTLADILAADREYPAGRRTIDQQIQYLNRTYGGRVRKLHCREMDVSSEMLRQMVREGRSIAPYVPPAVESYIRLHHLYQEVLYEPTDSRTEESPCAKTQCQPV